MDDVFPKTVGLNKFSDGLLTPSHEKLISTKVYICSMFKKSNLIIFASNIKVIKCAS